MIANALTFFRITASAVLLFCPVFSPAFYAFYIAAGLSDMLDGFAARKTNAASELGAKLDTAADLVFAAVCLIRLLPVLDLPAWLYVWAGIIAFIKLVNVVSGFAVRRRFVSVHSVMNKAAGALAFLFPLTVPFANPGRFAIAVCLTATFAAVQEGHLIRSAKEVR